MTGLRYEISYGKTRVPVYRRDATPLIVAAVPESLFTGRANDVLAFEVDIEVHGDAFLPAYTHRDNSMIVATDSMRNFALRSAAECDASTLEGFALALAQGLLETYRHMEAVAVTARELPHMPAQLPASAGLERVNHLHRRAQHPHSWTHVRVDSDGPAGTAEIQCGSSGLTLLKTTGSSFTSFVRDDHTTLPERPDRPLTLELDFEWAYTDNADAEGTGAYVDGAQVCDVFAAVFDELVSESIQHLLDVAGHRVLERYPQLSSFATRALNRTPDPVPGLAPNRIYTASFPAPGLVTLRLERA